MTSSIINIDRLKLIFNNKNIDLIDQSSFEFKRLTDNKHSLTHKENYMITYDKTIICYLSHKDRLRLDFSKLIFVNNFLYTSTYNSVISLFIDTFKITEFKITNIEIAINTNKKLTRNYYTHFTKNDIDLSPNYKSISVLPSENRFNNKVDQDTIYIKKKKSPILMRIENKTNEIITSSNKYYILDFYTDRLDITKDIYRLEIILDLVKLRNVSRYTKYQEKNNYSNIISIREFNKLDYIDQSKFNKIALKKDYLIDIERLTDESYLLSLLDYFKTFDYTKIIKTDLIIDKLIFENTLSEIKKTNTTTNNNYSLQDLSTEYDNLFD